MKCLDKKRIKLKGGETLALNERIMLSLVSTEVTELSLIVVVRYVFTQQDLCLEMPRTIGIFTMVIIFSDVKK